MGKILKEVEKRLGIFLIFYAIFCFVILFSGLLGDVDNMFALVIELSAIASPFIFMFGIFLYLSGIDDKRGNSSKSSTLYSDGIDDITKYNRPYDSNHNFREAFDDLYGRIHNIGSIHTRYEAIKKLDKLVGHTRNSAYFNYLLNNYGLSNTEGNNLIESVKDKIESNYPLTYKKPKNSSTQINKNFGRDSSELYNRVCSNYKVHTRSDAYNELNNLFGYWKGRMYFKCLLNRNGLEEDDKDKIIRDVKSRINVEFPVKLNNVDERSNMENLSWDINEVSDNIGDNDVVKQKTQRTRNISKSTRINVFERDDYTCQICGRNVKEDGVKLELDHIYPVSKVEVMI